MAGHSALVDAGAGGGCRRLGGGGGNYAYYPKAGDSSNQLRIELPNKPDGCLADGDLVRLLDRDTVRGSDYYLLRWPSGSWKDHLYLWTGNPAEAEQFRVQLKQPAEYADWSDQLRY